tara:strand:+ start:937 stop:1173 length:237 start_codon:yes stop_codon:yes gene_type:complete
MNHERLKKGDLVTLSVAGHNGFFYPGQKKVSILYDVDCTSPAWVGGGIDKIPVILPESAITFIGKHEKKVVVWKQRKN